MKMPETLSNLFIRTATLCLLFSTAVSCSSDDEEALALESDVTSPTTNYVIKGKVVNEANANQGIADIQVEIVIKKDNPVSDTLYTDSNGSFGWTGAITTFDEDAQFNLSAVDTTGHYQTSTLSITFTPYEQNAGTSTWFLGEAEKSITIKMRENNP